MGIGLILKDGYFETAERIACPDADHSAVFHVFVSAVGEIAECSKCGSQFAPWVIGVDDDSPVVDTGHFELVQD